METDLLIAQRYHSIEWALDERLKRLFVASEAIVLGYGGVSVVAAQTGVSRGTIHAGLNEIKNHSIPSAVTGGCVRKSGGGRKEQPPLTNRYLMISMC